MLSKWLGDLGPDFAASMIGSESMTSSDWMLLALSGMGQDSQKKVGEAFVQRLLEKGDINPAVAILLGLREYDDAVEVYVSRKYYMEAVLLACLLFPTDWQRQSHLVRKWGEVAVSTKQPELAVRCFSCTGMESSEPWFSPRAQDAVYAMQQNILAPDTPLSMNSPVSATARLHPMMAGLKLVTNFPKPGDQPRSAVGDKTPMVLAAETPIDTAITPGAALHNPFRNEPISAMSARTATPGGYGRRRFPSATRTATSRGTEMSNQTSNASHTTPRTAVKSSTRAPSDATSSSYRNRSASASQAGSIPTSSSYQPATAVERGRSGLPSPAQGVFQRLRQEQTDGRNGSRERKPEGLSLTVEDVIIDMSLPSGVSTSDYTNITAGSTSITSAAQELRRVAPSPPVRSGNSLQSSKIRSIDQYINSLDDANYREQQQPISRSSTADPERRPRSRTTNRGESRGRAGVRYVKPAKRSPSSPVSMSPDDPALQLNKNAFDDERFYQITSPGGHSTTTKQPRDQSQGRAARAPSKPRRTESANRGNRSRSRPSGASRQNSTEELQAEDRGRGRSNVRGERSPESPRPMSPSGSTVSKTKVGERVRERSMSRRPRSPGSVQGSVQGSVRKASPDPSTTNRKASRSRMPKLQTDLNDNSGMKKSRELAAQELEARRLSLARRPSAPAIVHPDALIPKSAIEPSQEMSSFFSIPSELELIRGHTADPHALRKLATGSQGTSSNSVQIGLPATPRAMRHPKYMGDAEGVDVPAVPEIPGSFANFNAPNHQQESGILPATTFSPARSVSAPPEKLFASMHQRRGSHTRPNHSRQNSGNDAGVISVLPSPTGGAATISRSIEQALAEQDEDVIIVENKSTEDTNRPVVLPELQHLAGPPPPPPPPTMMPRHGLTNSLGVINIAIQEGEGQQSRSATPEVGPVNPPSNPSSAQGHRRGRGSISDNLGQKFVRNVRDRIRERSASRNRTLTTSPPVQPSNDNMPRPYETSVQSTAQPRKGSQPSISTTRSPYETPVSQTVTATVGTQPSTSTTRSPYETPVSQTVTPSGGIQSSISTTRSPYETPVSQTVTHSGAQISEPQQPQQQDAQQQQAPAQNPTQQPQQQPTLLPSTTYGGYRNPKDIARQMREDQVQLGAEVPDRAGSQSVPAVPSRSNSVYQGYKNRELRANMPPEQLQFGVEPHPDGSGRI
jgi:hypothetical protein